MTNALINSIEPDYTSLADHPFSNIMPMMSEEDFGRHKADIKRNGLQVRIDIFEGIAADA